METTRLGKTGLIVSRTGFGALPIQRNTDAEAVRLLRRAQEAGITFYDTARSYTDSEHKLGLAFAPQTRDRIVLATKTMAGNAKGFWDDLHASLRELNTDHVDLYQFHFAKFMPQPGGQDGLYDAALEAKRQGKIAHIGITSHRIDVAQQAAESGLYETVQFPFSLLSGEPEMKLVETCAQNDVGFIAMKALSGGLITNARPTFAFIRQFAHVVPIWGIQHMHELEEFIALEQNPPVMDDALRSEIEADRKALSGDFCRGCGYCLPCPADIDIPLAARIYWWVTRALYQPMITHEMQKKMAKVEECIRCGACAKRCPYGLDTPELLRRQRALYTEFVAKHADEVK